MTSAERTLIVGLGHPDRGDDAVGGVVVQGLQALDLTDVDLVERDDPIRLLDLWSGYGQVIVIDALRTGDRPGTVQVRDPANVPLPGSAGTSSHVLDLVEVVELARSLGQSPPRLVLVTIEAADVDIGHPLSPAVQSAVGDAIAAVVQTINEQVSADV